MQPEEDHISFDSQGVLSSNIVQPQGRPYVDLAIAEPNLRREDRPTPTAATAELNHEREDRLKPALTAGIQDPYLS